MLRVSVARGMRVDSCDDKQFRDMNGGGVPRITILNVLSCVCDDNQSRLTLVRKSRGMREKRIFIFGSCFVYAYNDSFTFPLFQYRRAYVHIPYKFDIRVRRNQEINL